MSAVKKRIYYFYKKMKERRSRKRYDKFLFNEDLDRFERSTDRKPASQVKTELKALKDYWGSFPYQYYRFDLYKKDCTLSLEEMKKYVPLFFFDYLFFPLSVRNYRIVSSDKLLNYALLKAYEVPQPKFLFAFDNQNFYDGANNALSPDGVNDLFTKVTASKLFIKPRFGSEGRGIEVFKKEGSHFVNKEQRVLDASFFTTELKDGFYIIQEGLVQHPELNQLYPDSVNTIRVITECVKGQARVLYALIRMGKGGNQVDNAAAGGVYVKVDPETGALGDIAYAHDRLTFDAHPDTGFHFKGAKLEGWPQIKELAITVATKFREVKYMGWDIAGTVDGPCVIELNSKPDMAMVQDCFGPVRDELAIEPEKYWYQERFTVSNVFPTRN